MKPCRDVKKIYTLMYRHQQLADAHSERVDYHNQRIEILKEYIHELQKPGYKQAKAYIKAGTTKAAESFVVTAGDTHTG